MQKKLVYIFSVLLIYSLVAVSCFEGGDETKEDSPNNTTISAPTGVNATNGTYLDGVSITWNYVSGADSYNVYRSESAYGDYDYIGYTYSTSYNDDEIISNVHYYYKVTAEDNSIESDYSQYDEGWCEAVTITLINKSSTNIWSFYVAPSSSTSWGVDYIYGYLSWNETFKVYGLQSGYYDLFASDYTWDDYDYYWDDYNSYYEAGSDYTWTLSDKKKGSKIDTVIEVKRSKEISKNSAKFIEKFKY